jgi:type IV pilus assembly protein PilW
LDRFSFPLREMDCDVGGVVEVTPPTANTPAAKRKFIQTIYYIRNYANIDADGNKDGIPTLVRSEFELPVGGTLAQQPAEPLVEGIERFRVEVGIDHLSQTGAAVDYTAAIDWQDPDNHVVAENRGDGFPDMFPDNTGQFFVHCPTFDTPCTEDELTNVTAVKLFVLARSSEASPGYEDTKSYTLGSATDSNFNETIPAFNDDFKRHVYSRTVRLNNIAGRRETP